MLTGASPGPEYGDSPTINPKAEDAESKRNSQLSWGVEEAVGHRNIEVHHNWLARLFRVKPVTEHLCFAISRKRARQEVTLILRQWRKYGVRDIQVDRERNIIFARVGSKNCEFLPFPSLSPLPSFLPLFTPAEGEP